MASPVQRSNEKVPKYLTIREDIIRQIREGQLTPGMLLPPERELAMIYQTSRVTVREAFNKLVFEGILTRKQGYGTSVTQEAPQIIGQIAREKKAADLHVIQVICKPFRPSLEEDAFQSEFIYYLSQLLTQYQMELIISTLPRVDYLSSPFIHQYPLSPRADSIIFLANYPSEELLEQFDQDQRVYVLIGDPRIYSHRPPPTVQFNVYQGVYECINVLLREGHRRIAFLHGDLKWGFFREAVEGFEAAYREFGIPLCPELFEQTVPWEYEAGQQAMSKILQRTQDFTMILSTGDWSSWGAFQVCQDHHLRIGNNVGLVTIGYYPWMNKVFPLEISTIHHPMDEFVRKVVDVLFLLHRKAPLATLDFRVPTRFIRRESCRLNRS